MSASMLPRLFPALCGCIILPGSGFQAHHCPTRFLADITRRLLRSGWTPPHIPPALAALAAPVCALLHRINLLPH
jgi:hypothetical protein